MSFPEGSPTEERPGKERETRDDGRYIIFYTFFDKDEVGEDEPSGEGGGAS